MILLIRLPIIFLLTLLQFAAPLIHAHAFHSGSFESSIHLPEFEQFESIKSLHQHTPAITSTLLQSNHMVVMSVGIKNELTKSLLITENSLFGTFLFIFLMGIYQRSVIQCFFDQTEPITALPFAIFAPRAPPTLF